MTNRLSARLAALAATLALLSTLAFAGEQEMKDELTSIINELDGNSRVQNCEFYWRVSQSLICSVINGDRIEITEATRIKNWNFVGCQAIRVWFFFEGGTECYYKRGQKETFTVGREANGKTYASIYRKLP